MSLIAGARQIKLGQLSYYDRIAWSGFSQKLGEIGYHEINQLPIPDFGSIHVLSRPKSYSPPSFLPRVEPVETSSAAIVHVTDGYNVNYVMLAKPDVRSADGELAYDADVMRRYFTDIAHPLDMMLLPDGWPMPAKGLSILGMYAAIGLAAGVGLGETIYSPFSGVSTSPARFFTDVLFGVSFSFLGILGRTVYESGIRYPALRMGAASRIDVGSYLFGHAAVNSVDQESSAQQFEEAAFLVHNELTSSGEVMDAETVYKALTVIQKLGVEKTDEILQLSNLPLERIVEVAKAHPGSLPLPASAR
ncbi:TPA: hypothetical protein HA231_00920 [Candidatus Woesearchaeota archaeon]|nr:hypothetical protein [Candidatus Woesearchaeota archaeon]